MTKILLVDDDQEVLKVVRLILEHAGFDVILAERGEEALASAAQEHPDLVLLDIILPEMSGYEVLTAIRADPNLRTLPVVMLSALAFPREVNQALNIGADGYVTKPFRSQELVQEVKEHLQP